MWGIEERKVREPWQSPNITVMRRGGGGGWGWVGGLVGVGGNRHPKPRKRNDSETWLVMYRWNSDNVLAPEMLRKMMHWVFWSGRCEWRDRVELKVLICCWGKATVGIEAFLSPPGDKVSLGNSSWPQLCNPPASAFHVLELWVRATMPSMGRLLCPSRDYSPVYSLGNSTSSCEALENGSLRVTGTENSALGLSIRVWKDGTWAVSKLCWQAKKEEPWKVRRRQKVWEGRASRGYGRWEAALWCGGVQRRAGKVWSLRLLPTRPLIWLWLVTHSSPWFTSSLLKFGGQCRSRGLGGPSVPFICFS